MNELETIENEDVIDMLQDEEASTDLTMRQLRNVLPKNFRKNVTPAVLERINHLSKGIDKTFFKEQMMSFGNLVGRGIGVDTLARAIKYVMFTDVHGMNNTQAYIAVFPDKDGGRELTGDASIYNRSKCVSAIR